MPSCTSKWSRAHPSIRPGAIRRGISPPPPAPTALPSLVKMVPGIGAGRDTDASPSSSSPGRPGVCLAAPKGWGKRPFKPTGTGAGKVWCPEERRAPGVGQGPSSFAAALRTGTAAKLPARLPGRQVQRPREGRSVSEANASQAATFLGPTAQKASLRLPGSLCPPGSEETPKNPHRQDGTCICPVYTPSLFSEQLGGSRIMFSRVWQFPGATGARVSEDCGDKE
ncbi:uncharacterized protein LOC143823170 [Paroedura picta]|uniref:uncharacterized protein LOC143823170 n=1 Tax=Paroedura picta TaxID=143630 RepID=UPI00405702F7